VVRERSRSRWRMLIGLAALTLAVGGPWPATGANAAGLRDISADLRANRNVTLTGDAVVRLTGGRLTYTGVLSGKGTFAVEGTGRLVLTKDSDFTLPRSRQRQKLVTYNGNHPLTRIDNADPPAVIVKQGATLQYGSGSGGLGQIGHYVAVPGLSWNTLNHRIDGTLDLAVHSKVHLGILSGTGLVSARRSTWPGLSLAGTHPFSGKLYIGTGADFGANEFVTSMPNLKQVVNQGSAIHSAADGVTLVSRANYFSQFYGNDINYHTWGSGVVRNTGVYSWSDNGSKTHPRLSRAALNYAVVPHQDNKRGINIEGATVQWGDGTTHRFFLPGNEKTVYLNMHFDGRERSKLTFNYNGPVRLDAPISGGIYHATMDAPGQGDVVIAGTRGNAVTFSAPQNYNGSTTIGKGASLRLGDGTAAGDSGLLRSELFKIVNRGALIVQNTATPTTLAKISGPGSLTQAGRAATTLAGGTSYRGATVITRSTLRLTAGNLAASSGVRLTKAKTTLDLTGAGSQTLRRLSGVGGSTVALGGALTVGDAKSSTFGGSLTGNATADVTKVGSGTLTLTGVSRTPGGTWTVRDGALALRSVAGAAPASVEAGVAVAAGATLGGTRGVVTGSVDNRGAVTVSDLSIAGAYTEHPKSVLGSTKLAVSGEVSLAGELHVKPAASAAELIVIDHTGSGPINGTFSGLPEGASVAGRTISYHGGDGNDVVLSGSAPAGGSGAAKSANRPKTAVTTTPLHAKPTSFGTVGRLGSVTAAAVLMSALFFFGHRRRPRRIARNQPGHV
jgi:autotransporter-associated beta strand protein